MKKFWRLHAPPTTTDSLRAEAAEDLANRKAEASRVRTLLNEWRWIQAENNIRERLQESLRRGI